MAKKKAGKKAAALKKKPENPRKTEQKGLLARLMLVWLFLLSLLGGKRAGKKRARKKRKARKGKKGKTR